MNCPYMFILTILTSNRIINEESGIVNVKMQGSDSSDPKGKAGILVAKR
jgi:hypothetical protein